MGRAKRVSRSFQRMDLGNGSWLITFTKISGSRLCVATPFSCFFAQMYSPLSELTMVTSLIATPWPLAKPMAALVGLPSASKAIFFAGPSFSDTRSVCICATLEAMSARRRGVPKVSICLNEMRRLASSFSISDFRAARASGINAAGISSVPISSSISSVMQIILQ